MAEDVANNQDQPYQALYRRYRPQLFAQVRGQEHVTRALRNAVREDRVAHAYLFSGPRGTGKTSTARILAMALNCESPQDGEPDGACTSCQSIRAGASMDVFELDAASNRKLDEMRDLLSRVALGTPGRWKVYIIDEVHQLTPDAASALLKTLEEPPRHVVFVLATTDPQKVLPTIQSRAQHFEFRLLDGDQLTSLLNDINEDADLGLSAQAVQTAVLKARGSARDAESALEQLAAAGGDETAADHVPDIAAALARRDAGVVLQSVAVAIAAGKEPRRLGNDLVDHLRNAFLALQAPSLLLLPGPATAQLAATGQEMGLAFLVRCMETIGQALVDMRDSVDTRVTLEVALVRLAAPAADTSPAAIVDRLERLERAVAQGVASPTSPAGAGPAVTSLTSSLPDDLSRGLARGTGPTVSSSGAEAVVPPGDDAGAPGVTTAGKGTAGSAAARPADGPGSAAARPADGPGSAARTAAGAPTSGSEGPATQARATLGAILRGGGAIPSRTAATGGRGTSGAGPLRPGPAGAASTASASEAALRPAAASPKADPTPSAETQTSGGAASAAPSLATTSAGAQPAGAPASAAHSSAEPPAGAQPAGAQPAGAQPGAAPAASAPPVAAQPAQSATPPPPAAAPAADRNLATRAAASPASPSSAAPMAPAATAPVATAPAAAPAAASVSGTHGLPTRDELTKAWGDTVLDKLPRPAKVYMANGRFSEVTAEGAIFALPDAGLLARAANFQADAESALSSHFGRPVPLRLVLDRSAPPPPVSGRDGPEGTDVEYDLSDFHEAVDAPAVPELSPEQRILQAFPGAVIDN